MDGKHWTRWGIVAGLVGAALLGVVMWLYCSPREHTFAETDQGKFRLISKCKYTGTSTYSAYVSVYMGAREILTTNVSPGYDLLSECIDSSIQTVVVLEQENRLQITMKNGEIKTIELLGSR